MNKKKKIAIWKPTKLLISNMEKLDYSNEIIGIFDDEIKETDCPEYNHFPENSLGNFTYDFVLIPFENFRIIRKTLTELYGVQVEKIFTWEEYRVKDCEQDIEQKYHDRWDEIKAADIREFGDKTVIIIGGSSGIGRETARCFLEYGANVIVVGRNIEKLRDVCNEFSIYGNVRFLQWDINDYSIYEKKMDELIKITNNNFDILVNSAGILDGVNKNFWQITEEDFDITLDTNLKSTYFLCQVFSKYFISNKKKGHIVNVASSLGFLPTVKPYAISKWGVVGLTKGLGMNLAEYGITVNGIAPGEVATPILNWNKGDCPARRAQKTGRVAFTCEIAQSIVFLAGDAGENFVGEVILCDGGDKTIGIRL